MQNLVGSIRADGWCSQVRSYLSALASGAGSAEGAGGFMFWLVGLATSLAEEPAEAAAGAWLAPLAWLWGRLED